MSSSIWTLISQVREICKAGMSCRGLGETTPSDDEARRSDDVMR